MMESKSVEQLDLELDRDDFMRSLIRELSGTLQDVVGLEDAAGFVSIVGLRMGKKIDHSYRQALQQSELSEDQIAPVLVDLKRRIHGDFYVIEQTADRIVLGNRACPFGDKVIGRPTLCMMTSNVFGTITADNLGFAKVELDETIALGANGCRIVVHLKPGPEADAAEGRVYFKSATEESNGAQ